MPDLLPNASHVARREFLQRVRSRAFVISTALLALVALAAGLSPVAIRALDRGATARVVITVTATDLAIDPVAAANVVLNAGALTLQDEGKRAYDIELVPDEAAAVRGVHDGRYLGALVISRAPTGKLSYELVSDLSPASRQVTIMKLAAVWISIQDGLQRSGLAPSASGGPFEAFTVTQPDPSASVTPSETQAVGSYLIATALTILIFLTVLTYGMWVAVSVVEEKSSRVMELMLSAASPPQMLTGKVVGVGLAGLTQYAAIVGAALGAILLQQPIERSLFGSTQPGDSPLAGLTPEILGVFVLFFLLGFLLYALLYAAAGSLVSRQEDVQQVAMPMIVLALIGYFAASLAASSPEASWVAPLSFVPFFSPYLMLVRVVLGTAQAWEVAVAVAILVATIVLATWFAARIYRVGVLMYGQSPTLRSYAQAFRLSR
jgi:ABC-2 type transport system permease protein